MTSRTPCQRQDVDSNGWSRLLDDVLGRADTPASHLVTILASVNRVGRGGSWSPHELADAWRADLGYTDAM